MSHAALLQRCRWTIDPIRLVALDGFQDEVDREKGENSWFVHDAGSWAPCARSAVSLV